MYILLLLLSDVGNARVIIEAVLLIETITPYICVPYVRICVWCSCTKVESGGRRLYFTLHHFIAQLNLIIIYIYLLMLRTVNKCHKVIFIYIYIYISRYIFISFCILI